jgi:spore coat protein CotH
MTTRRWLATACVLVTLVGSRVALAQAPTAEQVFDDRVLHEIDLLANSRDLKLLYADWQLDTYYPADMIWDGSRVRNVAIRSRGSASRNPIKLGLKIDVSRYVGGRTFAGLKALVLDNLWQDPGLMREKVSMKLIERLGQPAPREVFCRLSINHEYQGLYAMVEPIDAQFLRRTIGDQNGYLFDYNWIGPYYGEYLDSALLPYKERWEPSTHDNEADSSLYGPIRDMFQEINRPVDAVWRDNVERYVDLQQTVTQTAIDVFVSELDGLVGFWGINNVYLYRPATGTRHRFFTWDKDKAFNAIESPITERLQENVLVRRALAFDDLKALYYGVLAQAAQSAAAGGWLSAEIDRMWTLVAQAAYEDPKKPYSNDEVDGQIAFLREFARLRSPFVLQAVADAGVPLPTTPGRNPVNTGTRTGRSGAGEPSGQAQPRLQR